MADIRAQGIREIYCLGDIVGYGPNPCECLDEVIVKSKVTILGNHDQATLFDPDGFNPIALRAVYWTREQLETGPGAPSVKNKRWDFLGELHRTHTEGEFLYVHGSPREPTNEYVFPRTFTISERWMRCSAACSNIAFRATRISLASSPPT